MMEFVGKPKITRIRQEHSINQTLSLSKKAYEWLEDMRFKDPKFNKSEYVSSLIETQVKEPVDNISLVKCPVCHVSYSATATKCYNCLAIKIEKEEQLAKEAAEALKITNESLQQEDYLTRMQEIERRLKLDPVLYSKLIEFYETIPAEKRLHWVTYEGLSEEYLEKNIRVSPKNLLNYYEYLKRQV